MKMRRSFLLLVVVLLSLVLVACGGSGDANSGGSAVTLSQTFSAEDSAIGFKFPEGWIANSDFGQVTLASSQAAIDAAEPITGALIVNFLVAPTADIAGLAENATPTDVLNVFRSFMEGENAPTFGDVSEQKVGNMDAAQISGSDDTTDAIVYVVKVADDAYIVIVGGTAKGEMGNYEVTLKAVIESITYTAPVAG